MLVNCHLSAFNSGITKKNQVQPILHFGQQLTVKESLQISPAVIDSVAQLAPDITFVPDTVGQLIDATGQSAIVNTSHTPEFPSTDIELNKAGLWFTEPGVVIDGLYKVPGAGINYEKARLLRKKAEGVSPENVRPLNESQICGRKKSTRFPIHINADNKRIYDGKVEEIDASTIGPVVAEVNGSTPRYYQEAFQRRVELLDGVNANIADQVEHEYVIPDQKTSRDQLMQHQREQIRRYEEGTRNTLRRLREI